MTISAARTNKPDPCSANRGAGILPAAEKKHRLPARPAGVVDPKNAIRSQTTLDGSGGIPKPRWHRSDRMDPTKLRSPSRRSPRGFTLIEIVMVLAIAGVVLGGAVGYLIYSADERALRDASGEIELLAKRARAAAILKQTPYALEFREGYVRLMPFAEAGGDEKTTALGRTIGGDRVNPDDDPDAPPARQPSRQEYRVPNGMELLVKRWNTDVWLSCLKDAVHIWRFDPDGLCEPLSLRFETENSWAEDAYHPLTATIRESTMEVR
jgi:prepilin-type N-terminal cleavage/methylation domain-containing protein